MTPQQKEKLNKLIEEAAEYGQEIGLNCEELADMMKDAAFAIDCREAGDS